MIVLAHRDHPIWMLYIGAMVGTFQEEVNTETES